jgi:hypothetical protein
MRKTVRIGLPLVAAVLVLIQFVQPERTNPSALPQSSFTAVANPPAAVTAVIGRSCRDCHSNQTVWPWYSRIAPISWLVARDVRNGRAHLNFSEWRGIPMEMTRLRMRNICDEVRRGDMPMPAYVLMHPGAKLSSQEVNVLCSWPETLP